MAQLILNKLATDSVLITSLGEHETNAPQKQRRDVEGRSAAQGVCSTCFVAALLLAPPFGMLALDRSLQPERPLYAPPPPHPPTPQVIARDISFLMDGAYSNRTHTGETTASP